MKRFKDFKNIEKKFKTDQYNICFWLGDFNYRINLSMKEFQENYSKKKFDVKLKMKIIN